MNAKIVLNLLATTILVISIVESHNIVTSGLNGGDDDTSMITRIQNSFVATTTETSIGESFNEDDDGSSSSEEDDDNKDDDDKKYSQVIKTKSQSSTENVVSPLVQLFNVVTNAMLKSAADAVRRQGAQLIGTDQSSSDSGSDESVDDNDNDNFTENVNDDVTTPKEELKEVGRQAGSYIKGDPLNGYYDFVITEGSYKFWVIFQLGTAALLIYSTLAAIYYSKVNPLTSDYDYVDYLSRSFHSGSLDTADVDEDDDDKSVENSTKKISVSDAGRSYLTSLTDNKWFMAAAYGFQFALDAIDKVPK